MEIPSVVTANPVGRKKYGRPKAMTNGKGNRRRRGSPKPRAKLIPKASGTPIPTP
jgi:hypothetical protein